MTEPDIVLCNPPSPIGQLADHEAAYGMGALREAYAQPIPPHTLAYCGGLLQQAGWHVSAIDAVAEGLDIASTLSILSKREPTLLILLVSPQTATSDLVFISALRKALPHSRLLLIGQATQYLPPRLVRASDMVLTGEPEGLIDAACRYLLSHEGHIGRCSSEQLVEESASSLAKLDTLPMPAWELFPLKRYSYLPLMISRGCGNRCGYCPVPVTQGKVSRFRNPEEIASEMQQLSRRYKIKNFRFLAPLFGANRSHAVTLCKAIIQFGLPSDVSWHCETRPEQLDRSLLQCMKWAGCKTIHLGLESVSPQTLISIGRLPNEKTVRDYLTQLRLVIFACHDLEIECHLHLMAGLPGDPASAAVTRAFLRAYPPTVINVAPLTPYPGTTIFPTNQIDKELALLQKTEQNQQRAAYHNRSSPWSNALNWLGGLISVFA